MTAREAGVWARPGDRLVIRRHRLGEHERDGEILEALGENADPPFRVRSSDTGAETLLFPGSHAYADHLAHAAAPRKRRP